MTTNFDDLFGAIKPRGQYSTPTATIIYGDVGCGKTILATTAQELGKCVLINFENRISHIDETPNLRIVPKSVGEVREDIACTYDQFCNFIAFIKKENVKFDHLILDTGDEMFQKFLMGMLRKGEIGDKYYGRAEVYVKIWNYLKDIKDMGISIIMTCHQKSNDDINLLLSDALKTKVNMTVDNIFYLKANDDGNRTLQLKPTSRIAAKLTTKPELYNDIPNELTNPTWTKIKEVIGQ